MKNIFLILFCLSNFFAFAQKTDSSRVLPKNSVYVELLGNGILGSLNYERIFWQKNNWRMAGRIGISAFPNLDKDSDNLKYFQYTVPTELSLLYGKNRHFLEFGAGVTLGFMDRLMFTYKRTTEINGVRVTDTDEHHERYTILVPMFRLGYRYQGKNGFLFRFGLLGGIAKGSIAGGNDLYVFPSLGFSFGKSF